MWLADPFTLRTDGPRTQSVGRPSTVCSAESSWAALRAVFVPSNPFFGKAETGTKMRLNFACSDFQNFSRADFPVKNLRLSFFWRLDISESAAQVMRHSIFPDPRILPKTAPFVGGDFPFTTRQADDGSEEERGGGLLPQVRRADCAQFCAHPLLVRACTARSDST